ncbi:MAG: HAD family phosphatase [Candidatus Cloacimonetes bacterium]|nr:HAD family phosphatase [Candidatus Cloacimonadota bacterium]
MIKAVIFDMDGVIIDSEPIYHKVEKKLFKRLGIKISEDEHYSFVGMSMDLIWEKILSKNKLKLNKEELIKLHTDNMIGSFQNEEKLTPLPDLIELIERFIDNDFKIALASSSSGILIDIILKKLEIKKFFEVIISGEDVENGKPFPDIFLLTAKHLGIKPSECLVIEDSKNGVSAAKKADMKCIGFQNSNSGMQDLSVADMIIDNFSALHLKDIRTL